MNWLDPQPPDRESSEYGNLQQLDTSFIPTAEEYERLQEEANESERLEELYGVKVTSSGN